MSDVHRQRNLRDGLATDTPPGAETGTGSYSLEPATRLTTDLQQMLHAPQQPDELGRLGGYRVLGLLGQGGMGAVFEADDPDLQRRVAVKVICPALLERFAFAFAACGLALKNAKPQVAKSTSQGLVNRSKRP